MGVRGEVFSTKVALQNRTYFFNVKENRMGDLYLNIVESKNRDEGGFDRQSVILFAEDLQEFLKGFDESLKVLEKTVREKRRGASGGARGARMADRERDRDSGAPFRPKRPHESGGREGGANFSGGRDGGGFSGGERRDGGNFSGGNFADGKRRFKARRSDAQGRGEDSPGRDRPRYREKDDKERNAQFPRKKKVIVKKR